MTPPTLAGFIAWAYLAMGFTTTQLPADSPFFEYAFNVALAIVNPFLYRIGVPPCATPPAQTTIYTLAVYNLAASNLLNWAQDPTNQTFFTTARANYGINDFVPGLVNSAADVSTSEGLNTQEFMTNLTLQNIQAMKDPYGRTYLSFAQDYGTGAWGIT